MFFSLIKKQLTVMYRNPTEIVLLLILPMGLITILSFALESIMNGDSEMTEINIAFVQHESEQQQLKLFFEEVGETIPMKEQVMQNLQEMLPVSVLKNQLLEDPEIKKFIQVTDMEKSNLDKERNNGEYDAIIEIPSGFTKDYLFSIIFEGKQPSFNVYLNEEKQLASTVMQSILDHYQKQYSIFTHLDQNGLLSGEMEIPTANISSEIKTIASQENISSSTYYTFSMAVMFILYIASTLASHAFIEKNTHIFDRIVLAQVSSIQYLLSIIVSTIILAFIQIALLFTFSYFIFGLTFDNIPLYFILTFSLSLVVAGISAFLSSINYRFNSADASNIFSSSIVAILAFFGGSYFNVSSLSPVLAKVGEWTPNGAALEGYLLIAQNGAFSELVPLLVNLIILASIFLVLAIVLFPKRGGVA